MPKNKQDSLNKQLGMEPGLYKCAGLKILRACNK